jgi:hypothetical protein
VPQPVRIAVRTGERSALLKTAAGRIPDSLQIDPDFDLWRALGPGESPPLLRDVMLGSSTRVMLASPGDEAWRAAAFELASRMLEVAPADLLKQMAAPASERSGTAAGLPGSISLPQGDARPLLIIGLHEDIEPLVRREPALARPSELARLPDAAVWSARSASGGTRVLVSVEDISALIDLHRRAPHYGAQGFIGFRNGKLVTQGIGAIEVRRVQVSR